MEVKEHKLLIGERFWVSFQRTLRIPDDGRLYPLPPGLGGFPVRSVAEYRERVPAKWSEQGGYFIPMYQREALWLGFGGAEWKPNAVKLALGKVNAISGGSWDERLHAEPQDYIVCPHQPWLDGINAGDGFIRQFIAMPLGSNYTVEAQITGVEVFGGVQILVYEPQPGKFPDEPPPAEVSSGPSMLSSPMGMPTRSAEQPTEMGLAAGGRMKQKIYPDPYGIETWDQNEPESVFIYIVNSRQYQAITGDAPPPTPVSAQTYTEHGFPWFGLYDESQGDVAASEKLAKVKSVGEQDAAETSTPADELNQTSFDVPDSQIKKLRQQQKKEKPPR